jgi:serine protease AprX
MKHSILPGLIFILINLFPVEGFAQTAPGKYWVQFTDKANTPYQISNPEQFLSQRAIERRLNQNISIQSNDLPVDPAYLSNLTAYGIEILTISKWLNAVTIQTDTATLNLIKTLPFVNQTYKVAQLQRNHIPPFSLHDLHPMKNRIPSNTLMDYGFGENQISMLNGHILHNSGYQGQGMHIAVIDAGFFSVDTLDAFDSLWINNQILGYRDFVSNDGNVFEDYPHGMQVLSILAANLPGRLVGTAPKASYWLLRTEDAYSEYLIEEDNWIAGAEFADSAGVDIITTSLGYSVFMDPNQSHEYSDLDGNTTRITIASDLAASKGILLLNSAGNEGNGSWKHIIAPADADSVLAIGATDEFGVFAPFSSHGPSADGRTKPNVSAQGYGTAVVASNGEVTAGSGTSFSCPVVSGLAACLWQANPTHTAMQIFRAIEKSGNQYLNPDSLLGYGIPNFAVANLLLRTPSYPTSDLSSKIISIMPNPFKDEFKVDLLLEDAKSVKAELIGLNGQVMMSTYSKPMLASFQSIQFNHLNHLSSGLYILRIYFNKETQQVKIIKQ